MSDGQDQVEVDVEFVEHVTDRAALCLIDGERFWLPWSLLDSGSEIERVGDSGVAYLPEWFCEKEGIPY